MDTIETRCPHCQALFRLAADQLTAPVIRCGRCRQTFTPPPAGPPPVPETQPPPLPGSEPPLPVPLAQKPVARAVARPVARAVPAPPKSRLRELRDRPGRDGDRPRQRSDGTTLFLVLGLLGLLGVAMIVAAGMIAIAYYATSDSDPAASAPRIPSSPPPRVETVTPAIPTPDNPATQAVRFATVRVWSPDRKTSGSGFVAGPPGHVVTRARLVGHGPTGTRPQSVEVTFGIGNNIKSIHARVVRADASADLALLNVDPGMHSPVTFGRAADVAVGDQVTAFGFLPGADSSKGASSSRVAVTAVKVASSDGPTFEVPHSSLDAGFGGGPVVNARGQVVGVCPAGPGQDRQWIIPAERVERFLDPKQSDQQPPAAAGPVVRPPTAVLPIQPPAGADGTVVRLPAPADAACVGGGGRFLVFRLPKASQAAILDTSAGKVVKFLPLAEENALVAAGMSKLFVLNPSANVIQRWSLTTLEKETTVPNPVGGTPTRLLVGHATDGPLYVAGQGVTAKQFAFLDPTSFREVEVPIEGGSGPAVSDWQTTYVRVSGDGRVYAWWSPGNSPTQTLELGAGSARAYSKGDVGSVPLPGPDGTVFTTTGIYTPDLRAIVGARARGQPDGATPYPATSGPWYFSAVPATPDRVKKMKPGSAGPLAVLSLKRVGDERPLLTLDGLAGLDLPADRVTATRGVLPLHDRLFFVPEAELLVAVASTGDQLHLHRFGIKDRLEASGTDYLVVTNGPPSARRGTKFSYTPAVLSKKGGVKLTLESGPPGMAVAGDTLTWDVPNHSDTVARVVLLVSDSTGQEVCYTHWLTIRTKEDLPPAPRPSRSR